MPQVTSDLLAALSTNFRALWEDQFLASKQVGMRSIISMEVPSTTLDETYNWFGTAPKMRQWIGDRQFSGLNSFNFTVRNLDWETGIEVDRNEIADDRLNLIAPRIRQMALEAARHQDELVITTMVGNPLCYDGQNFFDTDHLEGDSGTQINTAAGTGTTLAQIQADYRAARIRMRKLLDDKGRPMGLLPTHVLIPPDLEEQFRQLLNAEIQPTASPGTNIWRGTVEMLISPYLTDANDWFLLCLDQPVKPFVFQNRQAPQFNALDNPKDEAAFHRKKFKYGVDARYNVGVAFWQLAQRVTN